MICFYPDDPKLKDLVYELKEVDWNQLGIQLNVPRHILRNIDRENPANEPRKLSEVLQYWIDNEPEPSWEKIIQALQRICGHKNIITSIQSKYCTQSKDILVLSSFYTLPMDVGKVRFIINNLYTGVSYPGDPKLKNLVYELKEVDWNQLGIQLNVPRHILRNIGEKPGNESRKLSEVLQYWIDNEPEPSREKIIQALQRIGGHRNIITSIQSKYCTISPQPQGRIESPTASKTDESDHQIVYKHKRYLMAEGGVSVGSVSARPIHSLEEQLSKFPAQLFDSPCADAHLVKLSQSVTEWQDLAPYMRLMLVEERGILSASHQVTPARQCSEIFRMWR